MIRDAKLAQQKQKSMKAKEEGKAFLEANKAQEGSRTTKWSAV